MVDCLIAAVAWRCGAAVLACDADFDRLARVVGVAPDPAAVVRAASGAAG